MKKAGVVELRELFRVWFDASERKDLDAQMAPIAEDVVSYEHDTPQEYRGVDTIRQICAAGLDQLFLGAARICQSHSP
ncbi:hypothetical protein [Streptosporangium sp. NPDC049644]|uniref:hypothetical protein n=1 Tax=Streptosporangium sp. NPDC049644 TaxID=3155507 RepID=UPI0034157C74